MPIDPPSRRNVMYLSPNHNAPIGQVVLVKWVKFNGLGGFNSLTKGYVKLVISQFV